MKIFSQLQTSLATRVLLGLSFLLLFGGNLIAKSELSLISHKFKSYDTKRVYQFNEKKYFFYRAEEGKSLSLSFFPKNTLLIQCVSKEKKHETKCTITVNDVVQSYDLEIDKKKSSDDAIFFKPIILSLPIKHNVLEISTDDRSNYFRVFEQKYIQIYKTNRVSLIPKQFDKELIIGNKKDDTRKSYFSFDKKKDLCFEVIGKKELTLFLRAFDFGGDQSFTSSIYINDELYKEFVIQQKPTKKYYLINQNKKITPAKRIVIDTPHGKNKITLKSDNRMMARILMPQDKTE